jgi:hypothetical protein
MNYAGGFRCGVFTRWVPVQCGRRGRGFGIVYANSMAEMAHGSKSDMEIFCRPDFSWQSAGRTSLKSITSVTKLGVKVLVKLGQRVRRQTIKLLSNGLTRNGWKDEQKIMAWAQGGPNYRLISNSLDYNLSLHQYLMGLVNSQVKWEYVQTEIQHHVEEMALIRATVDSQIQAMMFLYCYLRDAHMAGWQSKSLQAQRDVELFTSCNERNNEDSDSDEEEVREVSNKWEICPKCGTTLHSGRIRACPWGNII